MDRSRKKKSRLFSFLFVIVMLVIVTNVYGRYDYNYFTKGIQIRGRTDFSRDSSVKYSNEKSYKVENKDFNDAMFYKNVTVTPNTPYRVTCMIKTQDVVNENDNPIAGAQIGIQGTVEISRSVSGTSDWTKVEFLFNSKDRTEVNIGFRLGGYDVKSKGTAWFTDFTLESGIENTDNEWNFACFIFDSIDVNTPEKTLQTTMTDGVKDNIRECIRRFSSSMGELSDNKIKVKCDIIDITSPITTLSYDNDNGYYVGQKDVYSLIDSYLKDTKYDHVYIVVKMEDIDIGVKGSVNDWVGLGGMDYYGIGYSNIRIPDNANYMYIYDPRYNTFPEEVFVHEFLHTLERNCKEYGYERPVLHDYQKYEYKEDRLDGLKAWYKDYMNKTISYKENKIGLDPAVFTLKPTSDDEFQFAYKIDELREPRTFSEKWTTMISKITTLFDTIMKK